MRLRKTHVLILALVVILAAAATAVVVAEGERATTEELSSAAAQVTASASVPGGLLVWMQPDQETLQTNGDQSGDGAVFARIRDKSGSMSIYGLGPGVSARLLTGGSEPWVLVERWDSSCHVFKYQLESGGWQEVQAFSEEPAALCATEDTLDYRAIEDSAEVVQQQKADSAAAERFVAPKMEGYSDDIGPIQLPVNYDSSKAVVTALVPTGGGLFAFSSNIQAAQLTDLPSGYTKTLQGTSFVNAACASPDGYAYAVGPGPKSGDSLRILRIDPSTLATLQVWDTNWSSRTYGSPYIQLMPTREGVALWLVETTANPETVAPTHLWTISGKELIDNSSALPERVGIRAGNGKDDSVLLFGGYAKEAVSRFSLSSGALTTVPELRSPDGTWVLVAAE